jgi:short subunit dehydrogenase-like uncharacterized protein
VGPIDVVLFGATGVTGGNAVPHLLSRSRALGLTVAVAGRDPQRLHQQLSHHVGRGLPPEVIEADLDDPGSLAEMALRARVVVNAVGPYARSARPVIGACVANGADYLDMTGEVDVVAAMIDEFGEAAHDAGVRIVQAAGYEALPFDLAVLAAAESAGRRGSRLASVDVITSAQLPPGMPRPSDGVSGGTWASTVSAVRDGDLPELLDPACLVDDPAHAEVIRRSSPLGLLPRLVGTSVLVPQVPSPFTNPPVIHRTQELLRSEGGRTAALAASPTLRYREGIALGDGLLTLPAQIAVAAPVGALTTGVRLFARLAPRPVRRAAATAMEALGPGAGDGPEDDRLEGWRWRLEVIGTAQDGGTERVVVDADGHPGYLATSRLVSEAALQLADPDARTPDRTGHLTPAVALGTAELARYAEAGVRFRTP